MAASTQRVNVRAYTCDVCGRTFATSNAVGGHKSKAHRDVGPKSGVSRARPPRVATEMDRVADVVSGMIAPIREELANVEAQITAKQRELKGLRDTRTYIEGVLRKLDPQPVVAKTSTSTSHDASNEAKEAAVRKYVDEHATELQDGFTANKLNELMREAGVTPLTSASKLLRIVEQMHSEGVLRATRKVRGGAMLYTPASVNGTHKEATPDGA